MQLVLFVFVFILQNTEYIVHLLNTNRSNLTNKESELIVSGILVQIVQIFSAISAIRVRFILHEHRIYCSFIEHESLESHE